MRRAVERGRNIFAPFAILLVEDDAASLSPIPASREVCREEFTIVRIAFDCDPLADTEVRLDCGTDCFVVRFE